MSTATMSESTPFGQPWDAPDDVRITAVRASYVLSMMGSFSRRLTSSQPSQAGLRDVV